jgi:hypothetical protein
VTGETAAGGADVMVASASSAATVGGGGWSSSHVAWLKRPVGPLAGDCDYVAGTAAGDSDSGVCASASFANNAWNYCHGCPLVLVRYCMMELLYALSTPCSV